MTRHGLSINLAPLHGYISICFSHAMECCYSTPQYYSVYGALTTLLTVNERFLWSVGSSVSWLLFKYRVRNFWQALMDTGKFSRQFPANSSTSKCLKDIKKLQRYYAFSDLHRLGSHLVEMEEILLYAKCITLRLEQLKNHSNIPY